MQKSENTNVEEDDRIPRGQLGDDAVLARGGRVLQEACEVDGRTELEQRRGDIRCIRGGGPQRTPRGLIA